MATSMPARKELAQILIVENDGIVARDIKLMLEELGYAVSGIASSGAEALDLSAREHVDLVLMDVDIKGNIDGIETAAQLVRRHRLPVVFLTYHTDDKTLARARETEPFGHIAKPITAADVKVAVAIALTRYQAQRQVEKREEWFQSILHSIGEGVIITNPDGRISFRNQAAKVMLGSDSRDGLEQTLDDVLQLFDESDNPQKLLGIQEKALHSGPRPLTGTILRKDQSRTRVLVSVAPLNGDEKSERVIVMHDISQLRAREEALQRENQELAHSNEKLTYLSYALSHDLKEPLRTISLYSDLLKLQQKEALSEGANEQLRGISDASRRMASVMSALVEYFSATNMDRSGARWIDSNAPLREALFNLNSAIEESQAQIETTELPMVYAHPTALMLIFQNLLGNAIKYTRHAAPRIFVSATREQNFWQFTVEDNGSGFDPKHAHRIFELFKRAHSRAQSGNGIGLATCQRLIEQHAGKIWAESTPGEGSRFHFTLPVKEPAGKSNAVRDDQVS